MKTIILNTEFTIGNVVNPKLERSERLMVLGYEIDSVSNDGYANAYRVKCGKGDGFHYWYSQFELVNEDKNDIKEDIFYNGEYFIGDCIRTKCQNTEFLIIGIYIGKTEDFIVTDFKIRGNDGKGNLIYFKPVELVKSEILI